MDMSKLLKLGFLIGFLMASVANLQAQGDLFPRIVNGLLTGDFPSTAAVLKDGNPDTAGVWCSATLIGCDTILTAAHCVCDTVGANCQNGNAEDPNNVLVYLQHGGIYNVSEIIVHPGYRFPVADVALLKLSSPVEGIKPTLINTIRNVAFGTTGEIAGFGRTGGNNYDYGLKHYGEVETARCAGGVSNTTSVCWNFSNPLGPPGEDSNTCNADSGGPLFVEYDGVQVVAGITSGGASFNCLPSDNSYDTNVFNYQAWILDNGGSDVGQQSCGLLPVVGEPGATTTYNSGSLNFSNSDDLHSFEVPTDTQVLRIAMNAIDDGLSDYDLYVKAGEVATPSNYDCAREGSGQIGVCEFTNPQPGTWYASIQRVRGGGAYQLVSAAFAGEPVSNDVDLTVTAGQDEVFPGEFLPLTINISNSTSSPVTMLLSAEQENPVGAIRPLIGPRQITVGPDSSLQRNVRVRIFQRVRSGQFKLHYYLQDLSGNPLDQETVVYTVLRPAG